MELKIMDKKRNDVLKRTEITATMQEKTILSRDLIKEKVCAMLDAKPANVVVTKIETKFGTTKAIVHIRQYDTPEQLRIVENPHMVKRNFKEEKKEAVVASDAPASFKKK
ncbi:MAG: 30S ribosomal protein S24e [archaeon]